MLVALFVLVAIVGTGRRFLSGREGRYREGAQGVRGMQPPSSYEELQSPGWRIRVVRAELASVKTEIQSAEVALAQRGSSARPSLTF